MPLIYQSNDTSNSLEASVIKVERKHIKDAYFATRKEEPVYEITPGTHTVKSGDTLGKIAKNNSTTVTKLKADNGLTSDLITLGQKLTLSKSTKKGGKVSFTKAKGANVGEAIYIIVKTENASELELKINIKQGVEDGVAKLDQAIIVQQDDKDTNLIKATVGDYCNETEVNNKDDFKDWAIAKVVLQPKNEEKQKEWSDTLECLQDKKGKLYLLVDAHSDNEYHITYYGRNPDDEGKPDHKTCPNYWLDMDGKWFELGKGCDCGKEYDKQFKCVKYGSVYGPVYFGNEKLSDYKFWNALIKTNKVTKEEKDILIGMSENEGKLDSVQSYDSEILTAGAMQKTVNIQGKGEFAIQVKEFKNSYPEKYKNLFEDCGWSIDNDIMYYKDPNDSSSSKITGSALKTKIREGFESDQYKNKLKCKPLEPIVRASKDKDFQAKQVEDFIDRLKNKVLPLKPIGHAYKLKDYLKSKLGKATVLDHHINRPAYVCTDYGEALDNFFSKKDEEINKYNKDKEEKDYKKKISRNPNDWGTSHSDYEKIILDDYGKNRRGTDMENRFNKMKAKL